MRAPILFIYHGKCFDGFTAAWVFDKLRSLSVGLTDRPVEYFAANYGSDPPDCKGKEVWIVDFSYKRDVMLEKIIKPSTRTFMFDHHKSAEEALDDILGEVRRMGLQRDQDKVIFDNTRCGSAILHDEMMRDVGRRAGAHRPHPTGRRHLWLVDYIEDRDLWKWELPNSKAVSAYISSIPMTFEAWEAAYQLGADEMAKQGAGIMKYIEQYGAKARAFGKVEKIAGHKVPTINVQYMNASDHVGTLAEENPNAPFAAGYFRGDTGKWFFSLRSRGDFDVSEVAKQFGGGGHKNSAGFNVEKLPWETLDEEEILPLPVPH
jgi:oligoribonuclease NrnB/cAMP/cGMP phosphodiesterase (DHH superfamily)